MKIKILEYRKEADEHLIEVLDRPDLKHRNLADFFVGCAIEVPTDPYVEEKYNEIAYGLVGKEFEMNENCAILKLTEDGCPMKKI